MYIKPTSTYKMRKTTKASLALSVFKTKEQRDSWKNAMIQAELTAAQAPRAIKIDKKSFKITDED
jgi:hypothetical protein